MPTGYLAGSAHSELGCDIHVIVKIDETEFPDLAIYGQNCQNQKHADDDIETMAFHSVLECIILGEIDAFLNQYLSPSIMSYCF